ncbi:hypothetical protein R3W88_034103 [Solanum pinnatisectum]|uniref:Uncharacterized protein n=1 Tax=Solanum pinnatisectum TaxID=50273 RepID=A0AAV9JZK7_9SOLN|nr:hypothetical protein R3W88_034103 [Solanum pinnatisectum]
MLKISKAEKGRERGLASYSLRENFRIIEAFKTDSTFILLAEMIHFIQGLGNSRI